MIANTVLPEVIFVVIEAPVLAEGMSNPRRSQI